MTMTEDLTHILIFRTNINTESDKLRIKELMDPLPAIEGWNIDMDDIDRVLRVVSHTLKTEQLIELINKAGYECRELE
jgi:hypothetical protein